jgi:uncharacterized protein YneF (UPF0154 family)
MGRLGIYEYPDIGIGEAIDIIEKIKLESPYGYEEELESEFEETDGLSQDEDDRNKVDLNKLARLIGHNSSASGTFRQKIASLKYFGLLDEHNHTLTDLAEKILNPPTEQDYELALVAARDSIELFAKIVESGIELSNESDAETKIVEICNVSKKSHEKKIKKVLGIMKEFRIKINEKNWYGRFVDDSKLKNNLRRLKNPRLAEVASRAIWAQFNDKPTSASQILKVFDVMRRTKEDSVRLYLLKAIRDGLRKLSLEKSEVNKISDYLTDIVLMNYNKDERDRSLQIAEVALEALAYIGTERNYDKLLKCMFDYCKANRVFSDGYDDETGESYGRPEQLLLYLAYVNKDNVVEAIWEAMDKENDEYKRRELGRLLERIGEVKLCE